MAVVNDPREVIALADVIEAELGISIKQDAEEYVHSKSSATPRGAGQFLVWVWMTLTSTVAMGWSAEDLFAWFDRMSRNIPDDETAIDYFDLAGRVIERFAPSIGEWLSRSNTEAQTGNAYTERLDPIPLSQFISLGNATQYFWVLRDWSWKRTAVIDQSGRTLRDATHIVVPAGFVTNLASTPRIVHRWFPPLSDYSPAAVVHDWLYWDQAVPRRRADDIFLDVMEYLGVPPLRRKTVWMAVRLFGGGAWRKMFADKQAGISYVITRMPTEQNAKWEDWRKDLKNFLPVALPEPTKKLAFVIGNESYTGPNGLSRLSKSGRDAITIAAGLKEIGYDIDLSIDLDFSEMQKLIGIIRASVNDRTRIVIFYSGHGVSVDNRDYLAPVCYEVKNFELMQLSVDRAAVWLAEVVTALKGSHSSILLMDACRDEPTKGNHSASCDALPWMLSHSYRESDAKLSIIYAAQRGKVATEGRGYNSLFTEALDSCLRDGLSCLEMSQRIEQFMRTHSQKHLPATDLSTRWDFGLSSIGTGVARPRRSYPPIEPASRLRDDVEYLSNPIATAYLHKQLGGVPPRPGSSGIPFGDKLDLTFLDLQMIKPGTLIIAETPAAPGYSLTCGRIAVGRYPVTYANWEVARGAVAPKSAIGPDYPVVQVSWDEADAYARWLSEQSGRKVRLLTTQEWEYCCRGGTITPTWRGKGGFNPSEVHCYDSFKHDQPAEPAPVRPERPANPYGLYDMNGNVWEWSSTAAQSEPGCYIACGGSYMEKLAVQNSQLKREFENRAFRAIGFRLAVEIS